MTLTINNVRFGYAQQTVFSALNLQVADHAMVSLVGPSGCGKSTLLSLLAGIATPQEGSILINDQRLFGVRKKTALLLQDGGLFPWKTAVENLSLLLRDRGMQRKEAHEKAQDALNALGIGALATRYPAMLSGGQRQRVALARALVMEADLLLLDEPTAALDVPASEMIQDLIRRIHQQQAITIISVTHKPEEALMLGEQIWVMNHQGQVTQLDNPVFQLSVPRQDSRFFSLQRQICEALR